MISAPLIVARFTNDCYLVEILAINGFLFPNLAVFGSHSAGIGSRQE
jgi:hypothetical protein